MPSSEAHNAVRVVHTGSAAETIELGTQIGALLCAGDVVLLTGDLGAGKTQLAQGVGRALGVQENVISPTFNILLVHEGADLKLNHWDLYRFEDPDDLIDVDYFAQVESDAVTLVEWGDKFEDTYLVADLEMRFVRLGDQERRIDLTSLSTRGKELLGEIFEARSSND